MKMYLFHTKDDLRRELKDARFSIDPQNPWRRKMTPSEKRAVLAEIDHLKQLISTRKGN